MPHFVDTSHVALYPLIIPGFADTFDPDTAFFTDLSSPLACFGSANSSLFWTADMAPKASRTAPETPQKRRPIIAVSLRREYQAIQAFTSFHTDCPLVPEMSEAQDQM